jgi:hypothetical protein
MMFQKLFRALAVCLVLALPTLAYGGADELASAYHPNEPQNYGATLPMEASQGDLDFRMDLRSARDLSATEKFMLAGGKNRSTGKVARPWVDQVLMFCHAYHQRHGSAPRSVTPEVIAECSSGLSVQEAAQKRLLQNPFTGEWPQIDSVQGSEGNLYARPLTALERQQMAEHDGVLGLVLKGTDPVTNQNSVKLQGEVWYYRVYGQSGRVIYAGLHYNWIPK